MLSPDSEAMQIERRIFMTMDAEMRQESKLFVVVVIPTAQDLRRLRKDPAFMEQWHEMLRALRADSVPYMDLTDELSQRPGTELDVGVDGTHYGPRTNARIAARIARNLQVPDWRRSAASVSAGGWAPSSRMLGTNVGASKW